MTKLLSISDWTNFVHEFLKHILNKLNESEMDPTQSCVYFVCTKWWTHSKKKGATIGLFYYSATRGDGQEWRLFYLGLTA